MTWMQTTHGRKFDFEKLDSNVYDIVEIVIALGRIDRYNGHGHFSWSVLQHSLFCYFLVDDVFSDSVHYGTLMHDAHEAYVGDLISPIKRLVPGWSEFEDRVQDATAKAFGFDPHHDEVRRVDLRACAIEKHYLFGNIEPEPWRFDTSVRITPHEHKEFQRLLKRDPGSLHAEFLALFHPYQ